MILPDMAIARGAYHSATKSIDFVSRYGSAMEERNKYIDPRVVRMKLTRVKEARSNPPRSEVVLPRDGHGQYSAVVQLLCIYDYWSVSLYTLLASLAS